MIYTEQQLKEAAERALTIRVDTLLADYDPIQQHTFSESFCSSMHRLIQKKHKPHIMQRIAAIILVFILGSGIFLATNKSARAAVVDFFKNIYQVYHTEPSSSDALKPTWLPEGYEFYQEIDNGTKLSIAYKNSAEQLLKVQCFYTKPVYDFFVNVNYTSTEIIYINNIYEAEIMISNDSDTGNAIIWTDNNNNLYYISGSVDADILVKIAESIYF